MTIPDKERAHRARDWWQRMQPEGRLPDAAGLAQLRRATTPAEALVVPATHRLVQRLEMTERDWEALGALAATLAHVRTDEEGVPMATLLGQSRGDAPLLSPLRFQRLMQATSWEERMTALRRAIAVANKRGNVGDLAASLLNWTDATRTRWMFAYFGAAPPQGPEEHDTQTARPEESAR